jgi:hypothetical protein
MKTDSYCINHGVVASVFAEMTGTHHCPICHDHVYSLPESRTVARQAVEDQGVGE